MPISRLNVTLGKYLRCGKSRNVEEGWRAAPTYLLEALGERVRDLPYYARVLLLRVRKIQVDCSPRLTTCELHSHAPTYTKLRLSDRYPRWVTISWVQHMSPISRGEVSVSHSTGNGIRTLDCIYHVPRVLGYRSTT